MGGKAAVIPRSRGYIRLFTFRQLQLQFCQPGSHLQGKGHTVQAAISHIPALYWGSSKQHSISPQLCLCQALLSQAWEGGKGGGGMQRKCTDLLPPCRAAGVFAVLLPVMRAPRLLCHCPGRAGLQCIRHTKQTGSPPWQVCRSFSESCSFQ